MNWGQGRVTFGCSRTCLRGRRRAQGEFVDDGTETHFKVGGVDSLIHTTQVGNAIKQILYVDDVEYPEVSRKGMRRNQALDLWDRRRGISSTLRWCRGTCHFAWDPCGATGGICCGCVRFSASLLGLACLVARERLEQLAVATR